MYFRKPENQDQQKFWKMYIVTLACFLVIGIIPSIPMISKYGFPRKIKLPSGAEVELFPSTEVEISLPGRTKMRISDSGAQSKTVEIPSKRAWLVCRDSDTEVEAEFGSEGEITIKTTCPKEDVVSYYKEKFEEKGFSYQVEESSPFTVIKATKNGTEFEVKILDDEVTIVIK
jgi:preprotein translocase subunit SecF